MYVHTRSARRAKRQASRHPPSSRAAAAKSPFGRTGFEDSGGGSRISKFAPWRAANSDPSLASSVGRNAKNVPLARFCPAGRVSTSSVQILLPQSIKTRPLRGASNFLAEEVGFEPTEPFSSTVFKTAAFNHSAIPPYMLFSPTRGRVRRSGYKDTI